MTDQLALVGTWAATREACGLLEDANAALAYCNELGITQAGRHVLLMTVPW